MKKITCKRKIT